MPISHLLDSFDSLAVTDEASSVEVNQVALENERLASFETGYSAGWEDAVKAQAEDKRNVSSDLAQNLQDMSFTYHEALAQLNKSVEPLLQEIVAKVLPEMARATLGAHIVEQLVDLARAGTEAPLEITVSPAHMEAVEALLDEKIQHPFVIAADAMLGEGQAYLKLSEVEREIDTAQVISGIETAVTAFIHQNSKEPLRA